MTIEDKMRELLDEHCFFPDQIDQIMDRAMNHTDALISMRGRWHEDITGYPDSLLSVVWFSVSYVVAHWLDENLPNHFMRSAFPEINKENNENKNDVN